MAYEPTLFRAYMDKVVDRDVTVYLTNGVRITGKLTHYSDDTLTITDKDNAGMTQLVQFSAVATIMPGVKAETARYR